MPQLYAWLMAPATNSSAVLVRTYACGRAAAIERVDAIVEVGDDYWVSSGEGLGGANSCPNQAHQRHSSLLCLPRCTYCICTTQKQE